MTSIEKLSIKELKAILQEANVTIPPGIEKHELVSLAKRVLDSRHKSTSCGASFPRVNCFGAKVEECEAIFLFFHGYGADENQFGFFQSLLPGRKIAFVCPKSIEEGWWPLDVAEWAMALHTGRLLEKIQETPRGLLEARDRGLKFVRSLQDKAPEGAKLLVGGFSQGAAMSIDLALSLSPEQKVFLAAFSGFPVDLPRWTERAQAHGSNLHALVTHGKSDPLIPYMASELLSNMLKTSGANVRYEHHTGGHTLGDDTILRACREFFEKALI